MLTFSFSLLNCVNGTALLIMTYKTSVFLCALYFSHSTVIDWQVRFVAILVLNSLD